MTDLENLELSPIRLAQDILSRYFTIIPQEIQWLHPYNFIGRNSDLLLVTVGDSWTWGSDISENNKDDDLRVQKVYGNVLSNRMGADWLNLAMPGRGNFWIAEKVKELAEIIPRLCYKKIFVICTFTEVDRNFNTQYDMYINYVSWFENNIHDVQVFDKLLVELNERCVSKILHSLEKFSHVELKIGTNFLDHLGFDNLQSHQLIADPWYRILGLVDSGEVYTCVSTNRLPTVIDFIPRRYHDDFKIWLLDLIEKGARRVSIIRHALDFRCTHPLETSHRAWADYLLSQI